MGQKGDGTKRRILEKAAWLFSKHGYTKVTMQDICVECGLSKGGLYRHYRDKCEIFTGILKAAQQEEADAEEAHMRQGIPAGRILDGYLESLRRDLRDGAPGLNLALYEFCMENRDGTGPRILDTQYRKGQDVLASLIRYGVERGEFHPESPEGAVPVILFLTEGLRMAGEVMRIPDETLHDIFVQIKGILGVTDEN